MWRRLSIRLSATLTRLHDCTSSVSLTENLNLQNKAKKNKGKSFPWARQPEICQSRFQRSLSKADASEIDTSASLSGHKIIKMNYYNRERDKGRCEKVVVPFGERTANLAETRMQRKEDRLHLGRVPDFSDTRCRSRLSFNSSLT